MIAGTSPVVEAEIDAEIKAFQVDIAWIGFEVSKFLFSHSIIQVTDWLIDLAELTLRLIQKRPLLSKDRCATFNSSTHQDGDMSYTVYTVHEKIYPSDQTKHLTPEKLAYVGAKRERPFLGKDYSLPEGKRSYTLDTIGTMLNWQHYALWFLSQIIQTDIIVESEVMVD